MDKTVPAPAARLLDLIGSVEAPKGYDQFYASGVWRKPLTQMTVTEVIVSADQRSARFGSSAAGRYQIMGATLRDLARELGLRGEQVFNADLQDRLGFHLMRPDYDRWIEGKIDTDAMMLKLAKVWAAFPVPRDMQGHKGWVRRGQSYYAGVGANKAHLDPSEVWRQLEAIRNDAAAKPVEPKEEVDMSALVSILLAQLIPVIKDEITKAIRDRSVPLDSPTPVVAVEEVAHRVQERVMQEPELVRIPGPQPGTPEWQHVTNSEKAWYQQRSKWAALVSGVLVVAAPFGVRYGMDIGPEDEENLTMALTTIGGLWAGYAAYRAGTASKPLQIGT